MCEKKKKKTIVRLRSILILLADSLFHFYDKFFFIWQTITRLHRAEERPFGFCFCLCDAKRHSQNLVAILLTDAEDAGYRLFILKL